MSREARALLFWRLEAENDPMVAACGIDVDALLRSLAALLIGVGA